MEKKIFKDFDFENFWEKYDSNSVYYIEKELTEETILHAEKELGYKLPESYIEFMRFQNGGTSCLTCFPTREPTCWANNHVAIEGFPGIGYKLYDINKALINEGEYPDKGVYICSTPTSGHDFILLDYSECKKSGEPKVVHVDQESDYKITFLATNFESFVRGLVDVEFFEIE